MLRIHVGAVCAALALTCAETAVAAPAPTINWTGAYIGANVGVDWSRGEFDAFNEQVQQFSNAFIPGRGIVVVPGTTAPGPDSTISKTNLFGGGQLGYSVMNGNWVFGAEGDIRTGTQSSSNTVSNNLPVTAISAASTFTSTRSIKESWGWSARARAGFAWDRFQAYATGGLAGADVKISATGTFVDLGGAAAVNPGGLQTFNAALTNTTAGSASSNRVGWTLGGGGEMDLGGNVSIGLEYRHTDLGKKTYALPTQNVSVSTVTVTAPAGSTTAGSIPPIVVFTDTPLRFTDDAVTLRLNFRL